MSQSDVLPSTRKMRRAGVSAGPGCQLGWGVGWAGMSVSCESACLTLVPNPGPVQHCRSHKHVVRHTSCLCVLAAPGKGKAESPEVQSHSWLRGEIEASLDYLTLLQTVQGKEAGDAAQWLRGLAALPEDWGSIPSIRMAAHNCL